MKKYAIAILLSITAVTANAQYDYRRQTVVNSQQTEAVVVHVTTTYESVVVGQHCQPIMVEQQPQGQNVLGTVIGGVIGGALGSQVGGGTGRYVATGAGAIAGSMAGNHVANSNNRQYVQRMHCTPITQPQATGNAYIAEVNGNRFSGHTFRPLRIGDKVYVNTTTLINPGE